MMIIQTANLPDLVHILKPYTLKSEFRTVVRSLVLQPITCNRLKRFISSHQNLKRFIASELAKGNYNIHKLLSALFLPRQHCYVIQPLITEESFKNATRIKVDFSSLPN